MLAYLHSGEALSCSSGSVRMNTLLHCFYTGLHVLCAHLVFARTHLSNDLAHHESGLLMFSCVLTVLSNMVYRFSKGAHLLKSSEELTLIIRSGNLL